MRSYTNRLILLDIQIKEGDFGESCSADGRDEKCVHNFDCEAWSNETSNDISLGVDWYSTRMEY